MFGQSKTGKTLPFWVSPSFASAGGGSSFSTTLGSGLVSYWDQDEQSGVRADRYGSNALSAFNSPLYGGGVNSNACGFASASSQKLTVTNTAAIQTGDIDFSWAGWVCFDTLTVSQYILAKKTAQAGSNDWEYYINYNSSTTKLTFSVSNGSTSGTVNTATFGTPVAGVWYFVAVYHDSVNDQIGISVNNGAFDTASYSGGGQSIAANLLFGVAVTNLFLNGGIQSWGLWKKVLSSAELTALFGLGRGLNYSSFTGAGVATPAAFWPMNEASGNRVDSVSSLAAVPTNTPTRRAGVVSSQSGNSSSRFILGSSQYLLRSGGTVAGIDNITSDFTIAGFVSMDVLASTQYTLVGKGATADNIAGFWITVTSANRPQCVFGNGTSRATVNPTNTLVAGTWVHLAVTFTRSGNMKMFVDGSAGTGTPTASISSLTGSIGNTNLTFGGLAASTFMTGQLDRWGFWNRVLSDTEIALHRNSGNGRSYNQL